MSNPNKRRRLHTPDPQEGTASERLIETFNKVEPLLHELVTASQPISDLRGILGHQRANFIIALRSMIPNPIRHDPSVPEPSPGPLWPPRLPVITNAKLRTAALSPHSVHNFQRMEFLGDSYIQMISSRILYERFPHSREGPLSIMRAKLVANIPLSEYARLYDFSSRINGSPGWKVLADSFEAYVAGVALSDPARGVQTLTDWLAALYEPKMTQMAMELKPQPTRRTTKKVKTLKPALVEDDEWEEWDEAMMPREVPAGVVLAVDKGARNSLKFLVAGDGAILKYVPIDSEVGFEIVVTLSGWGFLEHPIGQGWGDSEEDACLRAAMGVLANQTFCEEMRRLKAAYQESIQLPKVPVKTELPATAAWKEVDGVVVLDD